MNFNFLSKYFNRFSKYPKQWIVEPTNVCNLNCISCDNKSMPRKKGMMSLSDFKRYFKELQSIGVNTIEFDLGGEPLLNPDVFEMIALAKKHNVKTFFSTNGYFLDKYNQKIFDSGLTGILIDFDGMTKKSYETFRVGSDFEKVKKNIENFCAMKKELGLKSPSITLSFIINKHNETEIEEFRKWAVIADSCVVKTLANTTKSLEKISSIQPKNENLFTLIPLTLPLSYTAPSRDFLKHITSLLIPLLFRFKTKFPTISPVPP